MIEYIERCVDALASGDLSAVPTDTLYALCCDPLNPQAVNRLCTLKGVTEKRPWPVFIHGLECGLRFGAEFSATARGMASRCWPGKLTLVVPCTGPLSDGAGRSADGAVGFRVPAGPPLLRELLAAWDGPITATSANPTGEPPAVDSDQVLRYFPNKVAVVVPGRAEGGAPSTVIDATGSIVQVIREGAIARSEVESMCHE